MTDLLRILNTRRKRKLLHRLLLILLVLMSINCDSRNTQSPIDSRSPLQQQANQDYLSYGYAASPNPSVKYQPDVIFIEGGPQAIRSVSADGLIWTIDGRARGAKDLRLGSIMLATSRAAGRVLRLEPRSGDLAVTLGPAKLGDFIRDADIKFNVGIAPDSIGYQYVPKMHDMYRDLQATGAYVTPPNGLAKLARNEDAIALEVSPIVFAVAEEVNELPKVLKADSLKIKVEDWEIEPYLRLEQPESKTSVGGRHRLGFKIERGIDKAEFLKVGLDFSFWIRDLRLTTSMTYRDGVPNDSHFVMLIDGIEGFDLSFVSGVENGSSDNKKVRIAVPVELISPIPPTITGGIPMMGQFKFKFVIETMLAAKNATLSAAGSYKMTGPIGIERTTIIVPTIEQTQSLVNSVRGISLAPSAFVFAVETRSQVGLGTPTFMAGPYAKLVTTTTVTRGSDLAPMFQCARATIKFDLLTGLGWQTNILDIFKNFDFGVPLSGSEIAEQTKTLLQKEYFLPDLARCR